MHAARKKQIEIVAFTGQDPSDMAAFADYILAIPSVSTPRVQEGHLLLDHLICETEEEYQNLIQHFISNKDELSELKNTLKNNKGAYSLFDAKQFVKNIEKGYKIIHKKYQNNEQTSDIVI